MSKNFDFKHLIKDEYDDEKVDVDWSIKSDEEPNKVVKENEDIEIDELDDISDLSEILKDKNKVNPEINIEIVNEDNKKGVKISINMEINKSIVAIDFVINKKTILKIANELKKL
jgi:hypothetical protein